jgi:hypothetical protein
MTLVQSVQGGNNSGSFSGNGSLTCTGNFPVNTTAGNFVAVVCFTSSTGTFSGLNISSSLTGGPAMNPTGGFTATRNAPLWKGTGIIFFLGNASSISSGTTLTYHATISGIGSGSATVVCEMYLLEFSGVKKTASPEDNGAISNGTSSTPDVGAIGTADIDLMLGAMVGVTGNISAGTGYTLAASMPTVQFAQIQYALNVATGSVATAWSGTEEKWGAIGLAFLPAPAVGFTSGVLIGF